ncbi:MAG TPA: hypothetical protein VFP65_18300 [Anaeromyxobacteraceae bacterium]|nr:hypothetical protein [Anaeromyxobacteraceae bacterium]
MPKTMERAAVVASFISAFGLAIWYSAPNCAAKTAAGARQVACRLRVDGALEGSQPCTVEERAGDGRLTLLVASAPRAPVEVRFRAELERAGAALAQAPGSTLRAMVRERRAAGRGAVWLGPDALEVRPTAAGPLLLRMVVPPAPENPVRAAVEVVAEVALRSRADPAR